MTIEAITIIRDENGKEIYRHVEENDTIIEVRELISSERETSPLNGCTASLKRQNYLATKRRKYGNHSRH